MEPVPEKEVDFQAERRAGDKKEIADMGRIHKKKKKQKVYKECTLNHPVKRRFFFWQDWTFAIHNRKYHGQNSDTDSDK